jgi:hypothetical protein
MGRYASHTEVSSSSSRTEIEETLSRYGADRFIYGWEEGGAIVGFTMHNRQIRFYLPMPDKSDRVFTHTPKQGKLRSPEAQAKEYDQAVRQKWRALALVIKAKLEAVESGITDFEDEFLAHITLPDGRSVGDFMKPQIEQAYLSGDMPRLLPSPSGSGKR